MNKIDESKVIFSNEYVLNNIKKWLLIDDNVEEYMKVILNKLGIKGNIDIYRCLKDGSLCLWVNEIDEYKVCISRDCQDEYPIIKFSKDGFDFWYQVVLDRKNNDVKLNMYKYSNLIKNRIYTYEIGINFNEYMIEDGEYTLELRVDNANKLIYEDGVCKRCVLYNQDKLAEYFINVDFENSIFDIYKKICEISLGSDVNKYSMIDLRLKRWIYDEKEDTLENKITNLIHLEDGELVSLIVTKDDKQVWYDKCEIDTSYTYDDELMQVRFFTCTRDGYINTSEKLRLKNDDMVIDECSFEIDNARREVDSVKKLVRTMFSGNISR